MLGNGFGFELACAAPRLQAREMLGGDAPIGKTKGRQRIESEPRSRFSGIPSNAQLPTGQDFAGASVDLDPNGCLAERRKHSNPH